MFPGLDKQQERTLPGVDSEEPEEAFAQSPWGLHQPSATHGGGPHPWLTVDEAQPEARG